VYINDTLVKTVADPCDEPSVFFEVLNEDDAQAGAFEAPNIWRVPTAKSLCDLLGDVEPSGAQTQILDCVTEATEDALQTILCPAPVHNLVYFEASGTYTPPAGIKEAIVYAQAPGGGGGGGRSVSTGGTATGGGQGGSGARAVRRLLPSDLTGPVAVTIGAPGAGGAGGSGSFGLPGGQGGNVSFGSLVVAAGGVGGQGGEASIANPTNTALSTLCTPIGAPWSRSGANGTGHASSTQVNGVEGSADGVATVPRGGSGGGRVTSGTPFIGGDGGGIFNNSALVPGGNGASTAGSDGSPGADNVKVDYLALWTDLVPTIGAGTGGGGGAYRSNGNGGNGGAGGKGTGGAGGGGCINTATGGSGAAGGGGFITILEIL
jgi:hypothetical protein